MYFLSVSHQRVLVVDLGGSSVRAGVLSESETPYPQVFFPCVAATHGRSKDKTAYGFNALAPDCRASSKLHFPFRKQAKLEQVSKGGAGQDMAG